MPFSIELAVGVDTNQGRGKSRGASYEATSRSSPDYVAQTSGSEHREEGLGPPDVPGPRSQWASRWSLCVVALHCTVRCRAQKAWRCLQPDGRTRSLRTGELLTLTLGRARLRPGVLGGGEAITAFSVDEPSRWRACVEYLQAGIEHIWGGIDHLLFLISLLLPAVLSRTKGRWEPVANARPAFYSILKVVTAFTLAHSITLTLAALDVVRLPSRLTESVIAASIIVAAVNNIFPVVTESRARIAFGFGLLHGFGFASVLADMGLPSGAASCAVARGVQPGYRGRATGRCARSHAGGVPTSCRAFVSDCVPSMGVGGHRLPLGLGPGLVQRAVLAQGVSWHASTSLTTAHVRFRGYVRKLFEATGSGIAVEVLATARSAESLEKYWLEWLEEILWAVNPRAIEAHGRDPVSALRSLECSGTCWCSMRLLEPRAFCFLRREVVGAFVRSRPGRWSGKWDRLEFHAARDLER